MITNFSKKPWDGVGTSLFTNNMDEAIKSANMDWEVGLHDVHLRSIEIAGFTRNIAVPGYKAVRREDTGEIFSVLSDKYAPLQNKEAFGIFQPLVDSGDLVLDTAGYFQGGKKTFIVAKTNLSDEEIDYNDKIQPYLLISNSHDGTSALRFGFISIRIRCQNALTAAIKATDSKLIKVYHKGDMLASLEVLRNALDTKAMEWKYMADNYRELAATNINASDVSEYIQRSLNVKADSLTEKKVIDIMFNGKAPVQAADQYSLWTVYNAVNEFLTWERGSEQAIRLNSLLFADSYAKDQRAFNLAMDIMKKAA